jgi:hypothetical protein
MNRRLALTFGLCTLLSSSLALAQASLPTGPSLEAGIGYQGLPRKAAAEAPNGIQLADGVTMHVGAGAETGYDTNVFYQSSSNTDKIGSGIVRATGFVQVGNASRTGQAPSGLNFGAGLGLQYRRYVSDSAALDGYRNAFMPGGNLALSMNSGQFGFAFVDTFIRLEDTPYTVGQQSFIRDNNSAAVEGRWMPGGGRLASTLRYSNIIDIYESTDLKPSSSLTHLLTLDVSWKWLPKTAVFFQANQGYVTYLYDAPPGTPNKVPSFPLRIFAGLRGLVTQRLAALVSVGYMNGFYETGATTNGFFGQTYLQAQGTYTPTLVSRIVLGYKHDFTNQVIGNFSYDDSIYASYGHQLGGRVAVDISGRYIRKDYQGTSQGLPLNRVDHTFTAGAHIDYYPRNWIYAGVGYALYANATDATAEALVNGVAMAIPLDYLKQQFFVRLGITY